LTQNPDGCCLSRGIGWDRVAHLELVLHRSRLNMGGQPVRVVCCEECRFNHKGKGVVSWSRKQCIRGVPLSISTRRISDV
jgi:hypothetical protein